MFASLRCFVGVGDLAGKVLTFVVMPCLDEADFVEAAAASLGFGGESSAAAGTHLIAIDNGSRDGTPEMLGSIAARSQAPVHVVTEPRRGFVPPRRRGVLEAMAIARSTGTAYEDVLVLQADADTLYRPGYIGIMMAAAGRTGILLEGSTRPPVDFVAAHSDYVAAQRMVDHLTDPMLVPDQDDVIVDDKVCGYRLSDYLTWGGLTEEFGAENEPLHAETARMFIRSRLRHGASKVRVNPAGAEPSRRKVLEEPWLQYATVGFPREASWVSRQPDRVPHRGRIDRFALSLLDGKEERAMRLRAAHQLALFRYLPALVARIAGKEAAVEGGDIEEVIGALPARSVEELASAPGQAILDMLRLTDARPELFTP